MSWPSSQDQEPEPIPGDETAVTSPGLAPTRCEPTEPAPPASTVEASVTPRETVEIPANEAAPRGMDDSFRFDRGGAEMRPSGDGLAARLGPAPAIRVPGFEILGLVGRGGMGVVLKARQVSLDRVVALKVLPPALAADPARVGRFRNEAAVAARLSHAHILPLYDVLEADGAPILVMPFVDGPDLERILADRRAVAKGESAEGRHPSSTGTARGYLDFILPLLDQAVEAVAALHEAGILHRDIKPSNLLVDRRGAVFLTDFGLSRLSEGARLTLPQQGMGTPGYMAPEQWEGAAEADERADVFGLGATLYQALTLEAPYAKDRLTATAAPPSRPSARAAGLSADFDAVILKALEPDRGLRYPSAVALRDDWRRVRAGQAPLARPQSRIGRLVRRASRHRLATAALVMILLLLGVMGWQQRRLTDAEARDPARPRLVRIPTDPPGARVAIAPVDPATGEPRADRVVVAAWHQPTPPEFRLPPGEYFVEAAWDNGHFEQVYRRVPPWGEQLSIVYNHLYWQMRAGAVEFREIKDRALLGEPVWAGMTRFEGTDVFVAPPDPATGATFPPRRVAPFYLDNTEVTVGAYLSRRADGGPPMPLHAEARRLASGPREAVRFVDFDSAVHYAEVIGKRLPTEAEYRFAFTNGGLTLYPQGDAEAERGEGPKVGPVGLDPHDRLRDYPEVLGLHSNVAEWTMSRSSSFVPIPPALRPPGGLPSGPLPSQSQRKDDRLYLVLGSLPSVALGDAVPASYDEAPYSAVRLHAFTFREGVGLRCARGAEPYFLKPGGGMKVPLR